MKALRSRHPAAFCFSVALHSALLLTFSAWAVTKSVAPSPMTIALVSLGSADGVPGGIRLPSLPASEPAPVVATAVRDSTPLEIAIPSPRKPRRQFEEKPIVEPAPKSIEPPAKPREPAPAAIETAAVAKGLPSGAPEGAPVGSSAGALGQDGSKLGAGGPVRASYRQRVVEWLEQHKLYPPRARAMGMEARVVVRIALDRQGRVLGRSIEKGGGFSMLDRAAEQMVDDADPFPPPPPEVASDAIELSIPVDFVLLTP